MTVHFIDVCYLPIDVPSEAILRGSTNVFADLGFADAEERQTRLRLAYAINQILAEGHHTQAAAANLLRVNQPKVSALQHYCSTAFRLNA